MSDLKIASTAFENGGNIPLKYTGRGEDVSPPLEISGIDPLSKSIAIIVDDPDAPATPEPFVHWVIYNIPADVGKIYENVPNLEIVTSLGGALQGSNGIGRIGYLGPKPPFGTHTYRFFVYALDAFMDIRPGASRKQLEREMESHILQTGLLEGKFGF
jgi:Raf kinase inhibitor-like YbhB/YbcL family protein